MQASNHWACDGRCEDLNGVLQTALKVDGEVVGLSRRHVGEDKVAKCRSSNKQVYSLSNND